MATDLAIVFALLSAITLAAFRLVSRAFLKNEKDSDLFAFWMQGLTILIWLPLFWIETAHAEWVPVAFVILLVAGILWALQQALVFKSHRLLAASVREPLNQTNLIWASLFGVLFLGERVSLLQGAGIALLLVSCFLISRGKAESEISRQGVFVALAGAALAGFAYGADKLALGYFSPTLYAVLVTLLTGGFLGAGLIYRKRNREAIPYLKKNKKPLILAALAGGAAYWFMVKALSLGPVSQVVPLLELALVLTVVGGMVWLKETKNVGLKLSSLVLALVGAFLVTTA